MYRLAIALLLFGVFLPQNVAYAQASVAPLTVDIAPENPRPYQTITVTPGSTLIDLSASTITVTLNGKVVMKGSGAASVPITIGGPGERTTVVVSATLNGQTYTKELIFRPGDVALVVEPISSAHPFYAGGALTSPQGRVRVVAIPDLRTNATTRIPPQNLVYIWKFGNKILQENSGIGKSVLVATAPPRYRDAQLTVTVSSQDSTTVAEASTVVNPVDPIVRLYPNDPLFGPDFDHALSSTLALEGSEESFRGVAYFFGATPTLSWSVNNQPSGNEKDVTVRTTGTGPGTASLSFTASNSVTHQTVTRPLTVSFGGKKGTNLFGF